MATDGPEEILNADEYLNPGDYDESPDETDEDVLLNEPHTPNSIQSHHSQRSYNYPSLTTFQPLVVDTEPAPPPQHRAPSLGALPHHHHPHYPIREPKYAHLEARSQSMRRQRGSDSNTLSSRYTSDPCNEDDELLLGK